MPLFPFMDLVALQQPYVDGLHRREATAIYVSRGTGYWGPPMRLGAAGGPPIRRGSTVAGDD